MSRQNRIFAIANQKGGVGKTTSAVNLAASFAVSERRTLLIDLDPQANATSAFGISVPDRHIYDALIGERVMKDVAIPTDLAFLQLVPSGPDLVGAEIELVSMPQRERRLELALADVREKYEIIVIDCPPSLGLLTLNALTAADAVIVPLQCEYYALEGLARLLETIDLVRASLNPELVLEGIVGTMVDVRNSLGKQVLAEVRAHFGERVFQTVIPRNVRLSEAPSHGKPILLYDVRSRGAIAYLRLAEELLHRLDARQQEQEAPPINAGPGVGGIR
jgi:chromosome partitioning protein